MALSDTIHKRDTRANQPAASTSNTGVLYYVTDELVTERSNGTTWQDVSDGGADAVGGAASSTDNAIVRWDGTGGRTIQNSAVTIADTTGVMTGAVFPNTGLNVQDTNASHTLGIVPGSDLTANRALTLTTGDAARTVTISADATISQDYSTTGNPQFATVTVGNTGLHIFDSNSSHDLILKPGSDLTADRELTITTGDVATSITLPLKAAIGIIIDGGGSAITTGVKGYIEVPFACTIVAARMLADQSGSIVVDIWKDTYANYPPVDADSITSATPPTISAATKSEDTTLSGWTTSIAAGDILGFNVDSAATVTRVTVSLTVNRT